MSRREESLAIRPRSGGGCTFLQSAYTHYTEMRVGPCIREQQVIGMSPVLPRSVRTARPERRLWFVQETSYIRSMMNRFHFPSYLCKGEAFIEIHSLDYYIISFLLRVFTSLLSILQPNFDPDFGNNVCKNRVHIGM